MKFQKFLLVIFSAMIYIISLNAEATNFNGIKYNKNGTITITSAGEAITIADKNVGATEVGYGENASIESYGLYYQWGGMTGYSYSQTEMEVILSGFALNKDTYSPNIEGWTLEQQTKLCGNGYHIATKTDWDDIMRMYEDNGNNLSSFAEAFKIPYAGERSFLSLEMTEIGKEGQLRTSSQSHSNYASTFSVYGPLSSNSHLLADNNGGSTYIYGHTVRCVKNRKAIHNFSGVIYNEKMGEITVFDGKNSITLADKNVGATEIGYGTNASIRSYGDYYQWGGTTGYEYSLTKEQALAKGFVPQEFAADYGEWDKQTANIRLWAGLGICGEGYHIPNKAEWESVISMFQSNGNNLLDFYEAFRIPSAGERPYHDVKVSQDQFNVNLWTSTPYSTYIPILYANEDNINVSGGSSRANALPVRCFKDENSLESGLNAHKEKQSTEMEMAHKFAYEHGITSVGDPSKAQLYSTLTRIAMAKMLSQYAINVLGKHPNLSFGTPKFSDVSNELDKKYDNGVTLAYQLGIMGVGIKNFRPYDEVSRAEFATALSRLLYNTEDADNDKYYTSHIMKLYEEGILSNKKPDLIEKRGYVMIMLMRSVVKNDI